MAGWSGLPSDLLASVAERINSCSDHVRFGAVCKSWESAASVGRPRLFLPYILFSESEYPVDEAYPGGLFGLSDEAHFHGLLSLSDNKVYPTNLPEDRCHCVGSSHGWLLMTDLNVQAHLHNPLTGAHVELPPLSALQNAVPDPPCYRPGWDAHFFFYPGPFPVRNLFLKRLCLSSPNPDSDPNCVIMVICSPLMKLAFARPGDESWTLLEDPYNYYLDIVVSHEGKFYAVNEDGVVVAIDISTASGTTKIVQVAPPLGPCMSEKFLVVLPSKEVIQVSRWMNDPSGNTVFAVAKIDLDSDQPEWMVVENMGDWVLFLGRNSSLALSSSEHSGAYEASCIYYIDQFYSTFRDPCGSGNHGMSIFSLADKCYRPPHPCNSRMIRPPSLPIWITPNPRYRSII